MFSSAFIAATVFPGGSEAVLSLLLVEAPEQWLGLVAVATLGNTLGSLTSFGLGWLGRKAMSPEQMQSRSVSLSVNLLQKYGAWSLLLSWMPVIGDVLCLLAGWVKTPFYLSSVMIFIGKAVRYIFVASIVFAVS